MENSGQRRRIASNFTFHVQIMGMNACRTNSSAFSTSEQIVHSTTRRYSIFSVFGVSVVECTFPAGKTFQKHTLERAQVSPRRTTSGRRQGPTQKSYRRGRLNSKVRAASSRLSLSLKFCKKRNSKGGDLLQSIKVRLELTTFGYAKKYSTSNGDC